MQKRCQNCGEVVEFPDPLTIEEFKSIAQRHLSANVGSKFDGWW